MEVNAIDDVIKRYFVLDRNERNILLLLLVGWLNIIIVIDIVFVYL